MTIPIIGTHTKSKMVPITDHVCAPSSNKKLFKGNKAVAATPIPNKAANKEIPTIANIKYTNTLILKVINLPI